MAELLDPITLTRTGRLNDALICPAGLCAAKPDGESPTFALLPDALSAAWKAVIAAQPRTRLVAEDAERGLLHAEQRSRVFGFVDTIAIKIVPAPGGATFAAYSRARTGSYDFGVNRARLRRWTAALRRRLGP